MAAETKKNQSEKAQSSAEKSSSKAKSSSSKTSSKNSSAKKTSASATKSSASKTSQKSASSQSAKSAKSSEEKPKTSATKTSAQSTKTSAEKTLATKTSSSAGKNQQGSSAKSAKSKKSKAKKRKISIWEIILLIAVVIFAVWFFYFGGKAKIDSFLSKNFNTTSSELLNPESENQNSLENSQLQAENLHSSSQNQQNQQEKTANQSQTSETSQNSATSESEKSAFVKNIEIPLCPATVNGSAEDHEVHSYNGFQLCYRESYEDAEWVAYVLTRDELNAVTERSNKFHADKEISTGSATPSDYTNSGYDRGHLAPAADLVWSEESMNDSFLMSNMTPQAPDFNRGMWKSLEEQVRSWAQEFGEVVVVTGPILEKDASEYKKIGKNQVAVPEYFYKVLLAQDSSGVKIGTAFILPNSKCEGSIWDYSVSIDDVEKRTNLDFFSLLDDSLENQIEANTNFNEWK